MTDQVAEAIHWRIHLRSSPAAVFELLDSDDGRARFWAEHGIEQDGAIDFQFPDGVRWQAAILERTPPRRLSVRYFGGSTATFELEEDGAGGTDLILTDDGVDPGDRSETQAGWVSVLMALKAAADHEVDLRNHDPARTWDQGYCDN
jgi:uncharacterized protein YndB with AHSA1/START domain